MLEVLKYLIQFIPHVVGVFIAISILFIIGWCRNNSRIRQSNFSFMPSPKKKDSDEVQVESEE